MTEAEWLASDDPAAMLSTFPTPSTKPAHEGRISDRKLRLFAVACCRQVWHLLIDDAPCPVCANGYAGWGKDSSGRALQADKNCLMCKGTGRINRPRCAVEVAERLADGEATEAERDVAWNAAWDAALAAARAAEPWDETWTARNAAWDAARAAVRTVELVATVETAGAKQAALLRDLAGNPFRPVTLPYELPAGARLNSGTTTLEESRCPWLTPTVLGLARAAYEERREDGTLDPHRLAVLADSLEEAGCDSEDLLRHLRGYGRKFEKAMSGPLVPMLIPGPWVPLRGPHVRGCWALDTVLGRGRWTRSSGGR